MSSKIVSLQIENVKRISAVEITPGDGGCVLIGGANAAGKSSVLDSIQMALGGKSGIPDEPLRKGEKSGNIRLDLGDLIVERKFLDSGSSSLKVSTKEGASFSSPQKILDDLYCKLSFDPLKFLSMTPADQAKSLIELVGLDTTALDAEYKEVYEERTANNRLVKEAEADAARIPHIDGEETVPTEKPNVESLVLRINQAISIRDSYKTDTEHGAALQRDIADLAERRARHEAEDATSETRWNDAYKAYVDRHTKSIKDIEERQARELEEMKARHAEELSQREVAVKDEFNNIAAMKAQDKADSVKAIATCDELLKQKTDAFKSWQDAPRQGHEDIDALQAELQSANSVALLFDKVAEKKLRQSVVTKRKSQSDAMTAELDAITQRKRDMLASAKYPISGLAVSEEGTVMFDGVPFSQASRAQQIRTSVAIGLAMNPKLPVLLIRDGSLLDDANLQVVREMADAANAQIWIERVGEKDACAIIIEDGHIAGVEPVVADKPAKKTRKKASEKTVVADQSLIDQSQFL